MKTKEPQFPWRNSQGTYTPKNAARGISMTTYRMESSRRSVSESESAILKMQTASRTNEPKKGHQLDIRSVYLQIYGEISEDIGGIWVKRGYHASEAEKGLRSDRRESSAAAPRPSFLSQ